MVPFEMVAHVLPTPLPSIARWMTPPEALPSVSSKAWPHSSSKVPLTISVCPAINSPSTLSTVSTVGARITIRVEVASPITPVEPFKPA